MRVVRSVAAMTAYSTDLKRSTIRGRRPRVGFVPTMGALHAGHLALIRRARQENEIVVVSIFVNPTQFGPKEDYRRYPRPIRQDLALCRRAGVDRVFAPSAQEMYPRGCQTSVDVPELSRRLCGAFRPGHFRGVATVVAKLFTIIQPDRAYFGQKDFQQARIIQRLVEDLRLPIQVKVLPTVRERDGLAMSSRNAYLSSGERRQATVISRALQAAKRRILTGERRPERIVGAIRKQLRSMPAVRTIDYVAIVETRDLRPVKRIAGEVAIACAVWLRSTRLIDNVVVKT